MQYKNPIIKGFHPDPSICRVGEDYYLVTSSFEYFPGIPVFHSKDLVNWTQIGNCAARAEEFPLEQVKDSGGIWAPTIRWNQGTFYVTATLEQYGNFIVSAQDPAGEWSSPVWVPVGGIDPSLLFDGDRVYYCTNQSLHPGREEITLEEIDVRTGRLLGAQKTIWSGVGGGFLEAPHVYHIGDWYYLLAAEGGTNFNHMITVARSRSVDGSYESCPDNPVLTNLHDASRQVQCSGHGDLFQDHLGNWWLVHLATRISRRTMSHLGRETFLTPVTWEEDWPVVGNNRKASLICEGPLWAEQEAEKSWQADFSNRKWEPEWIFLRRPAEGAYERGEGSLKLHPSTVTFEAAKSPVFAAVRQCDFGCETEAVFDFKPRREGAEAGLAVVLASDFHYRFGKKRTQEGNFLVVEKTAEDFRQTAFCAPAPEGELRLCVRADKEFFTFCYASGEGEIHQVCKASTRFLSCELAGKCFTGTVIGLYAMSEVTTDAVMEVKEFKMTPQPE